jgi:hypothetical protein
VDDDETNVQRKSSVKALSGYKQKLHKKRENKNVVDEEDEDIEKAGKNQEDEENVEEEAENADTAKQSTVIRLNSQFDDESSEDTSSTDSHLMREESDVEDTVATTRQSQRIKHKSVAASEKPNKEFREQPATPKPVNSIVVKRNIVSDICKEARPDDLSHFSNIAGMVPKSVGIPGFNSGNLRPTPQFSTTRTDTATDPWEYEAILINKNKLTEEEVKRHMKESVFHRIKFAMSDHQWSYNYEPIAGFVMDEMKVEEKNRIKFWNTHHATARKALNSKRASVCQSVKESVIGVYRIANECFVRVVSNTHNKFLDISLSF